MAWNVCDVICFVLRRWRLLRISPPPINHKLLLETELFDFPEHLYLGLAIASHRWLTHSHPSQKQNWNVNTIRLNISIRHAIAAIQSNTDVNLLSTYVIGVHTA